MYLGPRGLLGWETAPELLELQKWAEVVLWKLQGTERIGLAVHGVSLSPAGGSLIFECGGLAYTPAPQGPALVA